MPDHQPNDPAARISAKVIFWRVSSGMSHDRAERSLPGVSNHVAS
jgi:hypothetical protein